jgi:hypothetical protein
VGSYSQNPTGPWVIISKPGPGPRRVWAGLGSGFWVGFNQSTLGAGSPREPSDGDPSDIISYAWSGRGILVGNRGLGRIGVARLLVKIIH